MANRILSRAIHTALLSAGTIGVALQAAPVSAASTEQLGEITVTGSRIVRRDFVSNSPITTFPAEQAVRNADVTLDTFLNTLPKVAPAGTTTSNNPGNGGQVECRPRSRRQPKSRAAGWPQGDAVGQRPEHRHQHDPAGDDREHRNRHGRRERRLRRGCRHRCGQLQAEEQLRGRGHPLQLLEQHRRMGRAGMVAVGRDSAAISPKAAAMRSSVSTTRTARA